MTARAGLATTVLLLAGMQAVPADAFAQAPATAPATFPGLSAIRADELRRDLFTLASDSMHGRVGGSADELRASMWLADRAREVGMAPAGDDGTYFQFFPVGRVTQSKG